MNTTATAESDAAADASSRGRSAWTLWLGVGLIGVCEVLLFIDVARRGGVVVPYDVLPADLPEPTGALGYAARYVAVNMTVLCWMGYLLTFDGLLVVLGRRRNDPAIASVRARPNRFVIAWLTSVPVWCFFDWVNFYLLDAWRYWGLPASLSQRMAGYFLAFAAISPGMFLAAQLYQSLGLRRLQLLGDPSGAARLARRLAWALLLVPSGILVATVLALLITAAGLMGQPAYVFATALLLAGPALALLARAGRHGYGEREFFIVAVAIGLSFLTWTILALDPIANLTLWVGLIFLLDPLNAALGGPSLLRDWLAGRFGRTLALFAGGATCGLLWEFWNYWAIAKWTYHLPFLGELQQYSYFEMPLVGFLGFLPFAAECWIMLNTIIAVLARLGLRMAEPLPDEHAVL